MAIPVIADIPALTQWRAKLNNTLKRPFAPKIPWNFAVASKQGGNLLTWASVAGADGYEIDKSTTGDFSSNFTTVQLPAQQQSSYFDASPTAQGATPVKMFYRMRATAGTLAQPQSVKGKDTGVLSSTAIAPNDTTATSSSSGDTSTTDFSQAKAGIGRYFTV